MRDHVHLLMMFDPHMNLKYKYGNQRFWSEGHYISTAGLNSETITKYIREQEVHDIMIDKLSVKDYRDPFEEKGRMKEHKRKKKQIKTPFEGERVSKVTA